MLASKYVVEDEIKLLRNEKDLWLFHLLAKVRHTWHSSTCLLMRTKARQLMIALHSNSDKKVVIVHNRLKKTLLLNVS